MLVAGDKFGYVSLRATNDIEVEAKDQGETNQMTALERTTGTRLEANLQNHDIFYARVNSTFMKPDALTSGLKSVSSLLLKKALPT